MRGYGTSVALPTNAPSRDRARVSERRPGSISHYSRLWVHRRTGGLLRVEGSPPLGRKLLSVALPPPLAVLVGVLVGHGGLEVAVGVLLLDPAEEGLEFFGLAEEIEGVEALVEFFVGVGGVQLLVAGFAEGRAVFGFAATLAGLEVVEGDEVRRDEALAERAGLGLVGVGVAGHDGGMIDAGEP